MQVNLNIRPELPVQGSTPPAGVRENPKAVDRATFERSAAVERALHQQPDMRQEMVAKGEAVIGSPQYPPLEGIRRISRLLAAKWPKE
jgi:hypothetical protein